jgi:hypothetical protein
MNNETPTPRTAEAVRLCKVISSAFGPMVAADDMEKLERELSEAQAERDQLKKQFEISKGNTEAALNSFHAEMKQRRNAEAERDQLRKVCSDWKDTAEMLMTVVCSASGGDWHKESSDWQIAARKFVDEYYERLKQHDSLPHVLERNKTK